MKHFLSLADLAPEQFQDLLTLAGRLKRQLQIEGGNAPVLRGKILGMIFQKPSLRTRVSFDVAMLQLGGHALYLSPNEIQLGKRESTADIARVLGRYVSAIMARVFGHQDVVDLARWSPVPVINGLSDYSHPCQGLADYFTLHELWNGELAGRTLAYVGDGNNVLTSLLFGGALAGVRVRAATPVGYEPPADVLERARALGCQVQVVRDPYEAVAGADAIYTDVWTSMGQEAEAEHRRAVFPPYQVNQGLVAAASPNVVVLHCLPAHRGEEITDEVADGPHSRLFDQAENRLHAQKALLVRLLAPEADA
ncbi:MAG TPA: ornithine carbamoyltransferase [Ardenticatenaceae bacterium]|nr:ornithine carbamoyltransferase [Ardenticatenaceae bacterium]